MVRHMQHMAGFDHVLYIAHHEWHGIRQATAYCPGHKLLISSEQPLRDHDKASIAQEIERREFRKIVFQGYSENADQLLLHLKAVFGDSIDFYVVTHVTTSQFEHYFEMTMQARLFIRKRYGLLRALGSVKPDFSQAFDEYWPGLIINFAPDIPKGGFIRRSGEVAVYAPLDPGWRKNMYTNILAGCLARNVDLVKTANFPNGLESICRLEKLRLVGYLRGDELLAEMASSSLVLLATMAECQPMTQIEAFAVGTPALTCPLNIPDFEDDPLIRLCTSDKLDNPALLARDIDQVIDALRSDPEGMRGMITDHLARRNRLATERYAEFLEL